MNISVKQVGYHHTNSYETLNKIGPNTKNVWLVFHGIGFLSKFFLRYFDELKPDENYIIAPQAPSKYYLNNKYRHVGASWLTKVDTQQEMANVMAYINAVLKNENIPADCNLIVLGFSQGVSIATRFVAKNNMVCKKLILYAGAIPNELTKEDFQHLITHNTEIVTVVGTEDEYINSERLKTESLKIDSLFQGSAKQITFEGGHEIKKEIINSFAD
ncbi:esterase [Maribacter sp. MMG018]|uniref:alpha/beta hydrolase n=1 Tax=Maribacter sp. MMG018 TaxID=2822688 RepID=UPI001B381A28|nr:esterase [Maribacter sp. MMG018]MBQ4915562.1 esterase [Maribacter sp. MMG018]